MKIRNEVTLIGICIWILIIIASNTIIYNSFTEQTIQTTGQALATEGTLQLCIGASTFDITFTPGYYETVSNITNITAKIISPVGSQDITKVKFYYGTSTNILLGTDTDNSDENFTISWNTTQYNDSNVNSTIFIEINASCTSLTNLSRKFTIDNTQISPRWNNWDNGITTNFSNYNNWTNIVNATIGNSYGKVVFTELNLDDADINSNINISYNFISINSTSMLGFNRSATVYIHNLEFPQVSAQYIRIFKEDAQCSNCELLSFINGNATFTVEEFSKYTLVPWLFELVVSDETDNGIKYTNENIKINASYRHTDTGSPVGKSSCYVNFQNLTTGNYTITDSMTNNVSESNWIYYKNYSQPGTYNYSVNCSSIIADTPDLEKYDSLIITNRPPALIAPLPNNVTWNEDTTTSPFNLKDYFQDPENQTITFFTSQVENVLVFVSSEGLVSLTPKTDWYGTENVTFYAQDTYDEMTPSNNVTLIVIDVSEPPTTTTTSGGGGGAATQVIEYCDENWECNTWDSCIYTGIQTRTCNELNNCNSSQYAPTNVRSCDYTPTCNDNLRNCHYSNGDLICEEGVDCGGPCGACPTCNDEILNQGEELTDCGGPCNACPEELIPRLVVEEKPTEIKPVKKIPEFIIWIIIALISLPILIFSVVKAYPRVKYWIEDTSLSLQSFGHLKENEYLNAIDSLKDLEKLIGKIPEEKLIEQFDKIIRRIFSHAFNIDYSFSLDDITKWEDKKNIKGSFKVLINSFSKKFALLKYGGKKIENQEFKLLIRDAKRIIIRLGGTTTEEKGSKLSRKFHDKLQEFRKQVKTHPDKAFETYEKLERIYKNLKGKEKEHAYLQLSAAYSRLKSALRR